MPVTRLSAAQNSSVSGSSQVGLISFNPPTMIVAMVPLCSQVPIMTPMAMSRQSVGTTTRMASYAPAMTAL